MNRAIKHNIDRQCNHTSNTQSGHPEPLPLEENRRGTVPHAVEQHYEKPNGNTYKRKTIPNSALSIYRLMAALTLCSPVCSSCDPSSSFSNWIPMK